MDVKSFCLARVLGSAQFARRLFLVIISCPCLWLRQREEKLLASQRPIGRNPLGVPIFKEERAVAISASQHAYVEQLVLRATQAELDRLRSDAEDTLHHINHLIGRQILTAKETQAVHLAIEFLVRIECRQNGRGWWFRWRRRMQLVQTYFGNGSAITSFAIKEQASDSAVRLKTLAGMASRYLAMPSDELAQALVRDFQAPAHGDSTGFDYPEAPEFHFIISGIDKDAAKRSLMVIGRGELRGYTLHCNDGGQRWFSVVANSPFSEATGAAKKLAKTMQSKFGVEDLSRLAVNW